MERPVKGEELERMTVKWTSEVLEKIKELPFVEDVEILTELPEDVEADLGIRIKLTKDADKYPVGRVISKVLNEISWGSLRVRGDIRLCTRRIGDDHEKYK